MRFLPVVVFCLFASQIADGQAPAPQPKIELRANGGNGSITVAGTITLPPGWKLSIHTLTVRHSKSTGGKTLNALIPVKGDATFNTMVNISSGSYSIWAVIDVKDADGREYQITSETQSAIVS